MILLVGVFLMGSVFAVTSYCCEQIDEGAWCQNMLDDNDCNDAMNIQPTACQSTSYCQLGTCIDEGGNCMPNTPKSTCNAGDGFWEDETMDELPQCKLGCCLIGDQAAFVNPTRCSELSSDYGLEINFRADVNSEFDCIQMAGADAEGACVYVNEFGRTCVRNTKRECLGVGDDGGEEVSNGDFYEGHLCSNPALGTNCGPSEKTTCVEGKDDVYFVDTCGNVANIYDYNYINPSEKADKEENIKWLYWSYIAGTEIGDDVKPCDVLLEGKAKTDLAEECGNCDYFLGSTCSKVKFGEDTVKPRVGDYVCRDLNCKFDTNGNGADEFIRHGESWCYVSGRENGAVIIERGSVEALGFKDAENLDAFRIIQGYNTDRYGIKTYKGLGKYFNFNRKKGAPIYGARTSGNPEPQQEVDPQIITLDERGGKYTPEGGAQYYHLPSGLEMNLPGSRHHLLKCYNGEVLVEPCADFRNEVCVQSNLGAEFETLVEGEADYSATGDVEFSVAQCKVNMWQDCMEQGNAQDCEDRTMRDCLWLKGGGQSSGFCVPAYAPGFDFWSEDSDGEDLCGRISDICTIKEVSALGGGEGHPTATTATNEFYCSGTWRDNMLQAMRLTGDCGLKTNYLGYLGESPSPFNKDKGLEEKQEKASGW